VTTERRLRRLAGLLLLWSLLPLPFVGITRVPFWAGAAAAALFAAAGSRPLRLSAAQKNLFAVAAVAVVLVAGGWSIGPLRPMGHLLLLLAALRVASVEDRRSFVGALAPVGLVWVVAVTASTHVALLAYLVLSVGVLWWAGMHAQLLLLAPEEGPPPPARGWPRLHHVVPAAVLVPLLAVPVFVLVPRLRSPWLAAGGAGERVTGFTAAVRLAEIGAIRRSSRMAMVVRVRSGGPVRRSWARFRATAFDLVRTGVWMPRRPNRRLVPDADGIVHLVPGADAAPGSVELEVELLRPDGFLFLPPGTVAVEAPVPLWMDPAGGVRFPAGGGGTLTYRLWLRPGLRRALGGTGRRDLLVPRPDPAVVRLAARLTAGVPEARSRAVAVERFLRRGYRYSLEARRRFSADPIGDFLFRDREGHCELFAGAMVILLRSAGVPARMVGGYSGGEVAAGGSRLVVRESAAHTWVEAFIPGEGWSAFDPTPAADVPGLRTRSGRGSLAWVYDRVQLFWDRHVLTFDLGDQLAVLTGLESAFGRLVRSRRRELAVVVLAVLLLVLAGRMTVLRRRRLAGATRAGGPAARFLRRLERKLRRRGVRLPGSVTPAGIGRAAAGLWPAAAASLARVVTLAEEELYGSRPRDRGRARVVQRARQQIRRPGRGRAPAPGRPA